MFEAVLKQNSYPQRKGSYCWKEVSAISPSLFRNYHGKLGLNFKHPSKGYLIVLSYRFFLKVKVNYVIVID